MGFKDGRWREKWTPGGIFSLEERSILPTDGGQVLTVEWEGINTVGNTEVHFPGNLSLFIYRAVVSNRRLSISLHMLLIQSHILRKLTDTLLHGAHPWTLHGDLAFARRMLLIQSHTL